MIELKIALTGLVCFMTVWMLIGWEVKKSVSEKHVLALGVILLFSITSFAFCSIIAIWRW